MHQFAELLPIRHGLTSVRVMRAGDVNAFHAYRSDECLARFQGWSAMTRDEALNFVLEMSDARSLIPGGWVQLGIAEVPTDVLIGDLGLFLDGVLREAEVGFTLSRSAQGAGHATRAVLTVQDLIFRTTPAEQIRALTDARNSAAIKVLQRTGFHLASEQQAIFKGESCTELIHVRRRSDA